MSSSYIWDLPDKGTVKIIFIVGKLKLPSVDGGFGCKLLTLVPLSEVCIVHSIPVKDGGTWRGLKVFQLFEYGKKCWYSEILSLATLGISICRSHFQCLGFVSICDPILVLTLKNKEANSVSSGKTQTALHSLVIQEMQGSAEKQRVHIWKLFGVSGVGSVNLGRMQWVLQLRDFTFVTRKS